MDIRYLGTEYGGWSVDLDLLNHGDLIIDAGLGEDVSFIDELNHHKEVKVIGIDPTEKSHRYVEQRGIENLELIKAAIGKFGQEKIEIFKNNNPEHVSESCYADHASTLGMESYFIDCISFKDLISKYSPALIKMDIEGAEYEVLKECVGVKQICVEFHHHCIPSKTKADTEACIQFMLDHGYKIISIAHDREYTIVLENDTNV